MTISDIDAELEDLKRQTLQRLNISDELRDEIKWAKTPEDEVGDRGFPCFALAPELKKSPDEIAEEARRILDELVDETPLIGDVHAVGPFVNIAFDPGQFSQRVLSDVLSQDKPGSNVVESPKHRLVEFSAPNTNKPQHLGHVRNNLIGDTVSRILSGAGDRVTRVNLINDRGIHICKSMLAYQKWGEGQTPEVAGQKGDHFVGDYYVLFDQKFRQEYQKWLETEEARNQFEAWVDERGGFSSFDTDDRSEIREEFEKDFKNTFFNEYSRLGAEAKEMLNQWESGDEEVVALWNKMNNWVLRGFEETYQRLGVAFDDVYFESETYGRGREIVEKGLQQGTFEKLDDGAVIFDLEQIGMEGQKVVLRSDGTSVYMTQDLGTADIRLADHDPDELVYVVGDEQDYHFQVLFGILKQLWPKLKERLRHLSYGMVFLPEGKLKSRRGNVVEADELIDEMESLAKEAVQKRYDDLSSDQIEYRAERIGLAALKFHMLDYNPRTTVHFDPEESIDFQGRTGPYCMYTYARIQSIRRRHDGWPSRTPKRQKEAFDALKTSKELKLVKKLADWPTELHRAAMDLDPGTLTSFLFELSQHFSSLYNDEHHRIVDIEDKDRRDGLLLLCRATGKVLSYGLELLGIETLDQM